MTSLSNFQDLQSAAHALTGWLTNDALPLWRANGFNESGGDFFERLSLENAHPLTEPLRARVPPRQIYSFAVGARLGWKGDWRTPTLKGLDRFLKCYGLTDGTIAALVDETGAILDDGFDLYNQAFALFGMAQVAAHSPDHRPDMEKQAKKLLILLQSRLSRPDGGFEEARPQRLPLCSNPHMHMFEAAMAWEEITSDPIWRDLADEIAQLCLTRFIDPVSGGLREFYDAHWRPFPDERGETMEPGHQFEWSWLLSRWGGRRDNANALAAARRLFWIGETYGICPRRGAAIMALRDDFTVKSDLIRLWPQTEWLKAALALAQISSGPEKTAYRRSATKACNALALFLQTPTKGLWRDKIQSDGAFVIEPAPASTFYHIVCAVAELNEFRDS